MFLFLPVSRPRGESAGPPGRTPKLPLEVK
nr:MAG TPA: hypothetical protein [Caudoviricetes sp.]